MDRWREGIRGGRNGFPHVRSGEGGGCMRGGTERGGGVRWGTAAAFTGVREGVG